MNVTKLLLLLHKPHQLQQCHSTCCWNQVCQPQELLIAYYKITNCLLQNYSFYKTCNKCGLPHNPFPLVKQSCKTCNKCGLPHNPFPLVKQSCKTCMLPHNPSHLVNRLLRYRNVLPTLRLTMTVCERGLYCYRSSKFFSI
jgi:hypothetical protein